LFKIALELKRYLWQKLNPQKTHNLNKATTYKKVSSSIPKVGTLEEKDQYVTIAFTTTCDYLVFATKFLPFVTIATLC
jgi:hypothetical protein